MALTRVCAVSELGGRAAAAFSVEGRDVLLLRTGGRYLALAPMCPHVPRFVASGDRSECVEAGVPKCNRHAAEHAGGAVPGIRDEPILLYQCREIEGSVFVDVERRELAPYQRITCSPVLERGDVAALEFNLWLDGEHKESVRAEPPRSA